MGQKLASYDDLGNIIAFYDSEDSPAPASASTINISDEEWQTCLSEQGCWTVKNETLVYTAPAGPTQDQTISTISYEIQCFLDLGAKSWGYNDLSTAATYATSTDAQFSADAASLIGWRDSVWKWAIEKFPSVVPGESPEEFMKTMPKQPNQPSA